MGFKTFISNGWNRVKSDIHQGLIGAKNAANRAWGATKKGLIGTKNFVVNNRETIGGIMQAVSPFVATLNPAIGAGLQIGGSILRNLPKGHVKERLLKLSEQLGNGTLLKQQAIQGSTSAQAAVDARRKATKWKPFRGI